MRGRDVCALITVAITIGAATGRAQTLAGHVSRGNAPIAGALVVLIDASGRTIVQTASRENGDYSVTAPTPGSYRAQVLQIGWRPPVVTCHSRARLYPQRRWGLHEAPKFTTRVRVKHKSPGIWHTIFSSKIAKDFVGVLAKFWG